MIDLIPMEFRVIVELDPTEETTSGGIILPGQRVERNRMEETEGTLIAASPLAFKFEENAPKADVGERVYFNRYAGILVERGDKWLRIVGDRDIVAVVK